MTGRLASRAAEAEALLHRFNEASEQALAAITRGDRDALARALDVRDALVAKVREASGEIAATRARFAPNAAVDPRGMRVMDRAMEQFCSPLEELARAALVLQQRLESAANEIRNGLLAEMATFENAASVATRYASNEAGDLHRLDVVL